MLRYVRNVGNPQPIASRFMPEMHTLLQRLSLFVRGGRAAPTYTAANVASVLDLLSKQWVHVLVARLLYQ